ncbi:MAG: GNAT family N-acetyltransferase [Alphaproteobacteria bacterium]|nr:GNAT family N-acetyltransferase [Alphaproteobacteria bacterium]
MAVEEEFPPGNAGEDRAREAAPISIRVANPRDADALALLSQELLAFYGLAARYKRSYMAHVIAEKAFGDPPAIDILMAIDQRPGERGTALGFIAFSQHFALANCQNAIFIQDLFVTRRARTLGIGARLMGALARLCVERGIGQLDWTADPWNDKARAFYEGMGPLLKSEKTYYRLLGPRLAALATADAEHDSRTRTSR